MFIKLLKKYIDLIKRIDPREDDELNVERFDRFSDILQPNEKILWQGTPSSRHAWGDHDQMESAGSVGDRPGSLTGRRVEMILALAFILFMFFGGVLFFCSGISELLQKQDLSTLASALFLLLLGTTLMSGLPFLLRPVSNRLRARQLTYILTSSRAIIVRRGHAWAEIWVRSPVILSLSLLFLYGVIMFGGLSIVGTYRAVSQGASLSTLLAHFVTLILMTPVGVIFAAIGYVGLRFQTEIILDAIKDRHGIFVRSFDFNEIKRNKFPVVTRLREDACGDVILGQDGHWEYDIDFPNSPWFKINAVGFLSVPDARQVSKKVKQVIAS
jgi:hypothetical protein